MKRPKIDDQDINDYINNLIEDNDELKIELNERKRSLENEYKELISDILSASIEIYNKHKDEENEITSFAFQLKTYIKTFSDDYKINF